MKVTDMRMKIKDVYPGPTWSIRVDGMNDNQVIAIYHTFLENNMFEKVKKARKLKAEGHQITIWEYLNTEENNKGESLTNERNGADP